MKLSLNLVLINNVVRFTERKKYMYPQEIVLPMKAELTNNGFRQLETAEAVDAGYQVSQELPLSCLISMWLCRLC